MSSSGRRLTKIHHVAPIVHAGQTFSKAAGPAGGGGRTPRAPSQARLLPSRDSSSSNLSSRRTSTASNISNPPTTSAPATATTTPTRRGSLRVDHPTSPTEADYACEEFKSAFPCYEKTETHFSNLRKSDFSRLDLGVVTHQQHLLPSPASSFNGPHPLAKKAATHDPQPKVYLDSAGAMPHSEVLVKEHFEHLTKALIGNPLTSNSTSSNETIEKARTEVLRYFKADPEEYACIFTASSAAALKIIGEGYNFSGKDSTFMLTNDNHESVVAIGEYAKRRGANVEHLSVEPEDLRLCQKTVIAAFSSHNAHKSDSSKLFAFPAQSNFSGVKHPLALIDMARAAGFDVLLDADSYCPSNSLNLSIAWMKPDFLTLSFHKMFGFPTGVGALIVKKGMVNNKRLLPSSPSSSLGPGTCDDTHKAFEDDSSFNFMNISAVSSGLDFIKNKCGGVENISSRTKCLTSYLLKTMLEMTHKNSSETSTESMKKLVQVYGPEDVENRGATVPFNVLDCNGQVLNYKDVEVLASANAGIILGAGLFSNPGACKSAFGLEGKKKGSKKNSSDDGEGQSPSISGALRVSAGVATNFHDIYAFISFLRTLENLTAEEVCKKAATVANRH